MKTERRTGGYDCELWNTFGELLKAAMKGEASPGFDAEPKSRIHREGPDGLCGFENLSSRRLCLDRRFIPNVFAGADRQIVKDDMLPAQSSSDSEHLASSGG
jgi:hypothetical protein